MQQWQATKLRPPPKTGRQVDRVNGLSIYKSLCLSSYTIGQCKYSGKTIWPFYQRNHNEQNRSFYHKKVIHLAASGDPFDAVVEDDVVVLDGLFDVVHCSLVERFVDDVRNPLVCK